MFEIENAAELIATFARHGVELEYAEASIILGYIEGHDYELLRDDEFHVYLHDCQNGENHNADELYSIRDCIEFCQEMSEELLMDGCADV